MTRHRFPVSEDMCDRVLSALNDHWRFHYMAPSVRELAEAVECNSTSVMKFALLTLAESGIIRYGETKGQARAAIPLWVIGMFENAICTYMIHEGNWALVVDNSLSDGYRTEQEAEEAGWRRIYERGPWQETQ